MEKTRFAILFIGRQGSSYLQGLIDSHPDAKCEGELFAPKVSRLRDMVKRRPIAFYNSRCKTVAEYLEQLTNSMPETAVGFKIALGSIERHPNVITSFSHLNYKIIRLSRENMLDQYISMIASANGKWTSEAGKFKVTKVKGDPKESETYFHIWDAQNSALDRLARGFPSIHITYERIATDFPALLDFLELRPHVPESRFKRQRVGGQRDSLVNYDEMKDYFAGSPRVVDFVE